MLNNAATTPPFEHTMFQLTQFMQTYGAFHRGAGPHANLTYEKTQWALETIRRFLGVRDDQTFLFTHNTSSAINYLVRLLDLTAEDIVLTTDIEHTSNNLPRSHNSEATILRVQSHIDGSLDMQNLEQIIKNNADRIRVVSLT
jgi:selenocysteine lyase/cysteine desulfurase